MEEKKLTATYDEDSKRFHRFIVDGGQRITGTIYIPKNEPVPDAVTVRLRTKAEASAEEDKTD